MGVKSFFAFLLILIMIGSLMIYYLVPFGVTDFEFNSGLSNDFNVDFYFPEGMQFYPNMRFPSKYISYDVDSTCNIEKRAEAKEAFLILQEKTILEFVQVSNNPEILVSCEDKNRMESGVFIAGEGGPTEIISIGDFNLILAGKVLLIRPSDCSSPNVAIHEILHVLGFDHSMNPNNIMYNYTDCSQVIGDDTIELIDSLYDLPGYPDLSLTNISARMRGNYLDLNFSVKNNGFTESGESRAVILIDNHTIKEFSIDPIIPGSGVSFKANNLWHGFSFDNLNISILYDGSELEKGNNYAILATSKE